MLLYTESFLKAEEDIKYAQTIYKPIDAKFPEFNNYMVVIQETVFVFINTY